jgi:mono/diheme cytochrome c family protein
MAFTKLVRPAGAFVAILAIAACHSGSSTSTAAKPSGGVSASATPAAPARPAFTAAMVTRGDSIFHARACANCHGADAKGRANGPDLTTGKFIHVNGSYDDFVRLITTGVPADSISDKSRRFAMAPRGGARPAPLSDDDIKAVAAYVYSLSHK